VVADGIGGGGYFGYVLGAGHLGNNLVKIGEIMRTFTIIQKDAAERDILIDPLRGSYEGVDIEYNSLGMKWERGGYQYGFWLEYAEGHFFEALQALIDYYILNPEIESLDSPSFDGPIARIE